MNLDATAGTADGADVPALHADGGFASDSETRSRDDRLWTHVSQRLHLPSSSQLKGRKSCSLKWLLSTVFAGTQGLPSRRDRESPPRPRQVALVEVLAPGRQGAGRQECLQYRCGSLDHLATIPVHQGRSRSALHLGVPRYCGLVSISYRRRYSHYTN